MKVIYRDRIYEVKNMRRCTISRICSYRRDCIHVVYYLDSNFAVCNKGCVVIDEENHAKL
jgi:hypothetical protein